MKILFTGEFSNLPNDPAPLFVSRTLYNEINKSDNETYYLTYFQDGKKYSRWKKLFGTEVIDNSKNIYRLGIFPYILLVLKISPDIIHLINIQMFYAVLFPLKIFSRFKIVYTMHGINSYELRYFFKMSNIQKWRLYLAEYIIMKFSDKIFCLSELNARYVRRYYKLEDNKTEVVPNGVAETNFIKEYSDNSSPAINAYFIGNPERREKGFHFLCDTVFEASIKMTISVFGSNSEREINHNDVKIKISEHLENEKLREKISGFDLFINASAYESFSLAMLECMFAGVLFLSSDRVGFTERLDERLKKLVFRFNNRDSFLSKLNYVNKLSLEDKRELSEHIRKFAAGYSIESVSCIYLSLYQKLLDRK